MHNLILVMMVFSAHFSASNCDPRCLKSLQQRFPDNWPAAEVLDLRRQINKLIKECDRLQLDIRDWLREAEEQTERMNREIQEDEKWLKELDRKLEQRKPQDRKP